MTTSTLFLGLTGSVAVRTVGKLIETAHKNDFHDIVLHPTGSALPFLVESILHDFPEIYDHMPSKLITEELVRRVELGISIHHTLVGNWFHSLRVNPPSLDPEEWKKLLGIIHSYESGEEQMGIVSREKGKIKHVEIARQSQVALIAPATANTIAKIVNGTTDNFLLQVIRAMDRDGSSPIFIAPAMNTEMLHDPFTKRNMRLLETEGRPKYHVLPTAEKQLQCGEYGGGALLQIDEIFRRIREEVQRIQTADTL